MSAFFPGNAAVAVSLSFDDARESQLQGARILDEHGIRASFYVLPSGIAAAPDRWSSVASAGHEIGNHTRTHPCSGNYAFSRTNALEDKTMEDIAADIDEAGRMIEAMLGVRPTTFAYPCGQSFIGRGSRRRSYVPLVAERFVAGRGYGGETGNMPDVCDLAHLDAYVIDGLNADTLMSLVDGGMARGEWVIMAGHDIGSDGPQTVSARDLSEFCRRLARDPRIWVAPVAEVAEHARAARAH
ncbi:polysaccharide deacetylase family protein [Streptomyces jeddahensis]|uniref:polysaccharide deacetylase family protein n=1 Tax=Streptomyces jeddahensis TaxID=1716141 RepID=UPI000834B8A8|nr:polysaccharide deacetylase family protein [Streptomyces jeddahensis]